MALAVAFAALPVPALAAPPGQLLNLNGTGTLSADDPRIALTPPPPPPPQATVHDILVKAAQDQGVDPNLLLAVSFKESSWRPDALSSEGAIGLLQVMPSTAAVAGPRFLGRPVNLEDPMDNAEMGAALLKDLLDKYDPRTALAAYYQGEPALLSGAYASDTWQYADSILNLEAQIAAGQGP
ncbi:MAG TPA: transglycosylase SLT domain-containing protein [Candidatus Dormibacteraeota bacterium]|jgi:soluble lytic murein transglycosylase-like protein